MRVAASELEAGDLAAGEMDFAADQSMRPGGIEWEGVSEQTDRSLIVGARCVIRTSDETQLRHRFGGGSYLSSSDRVLHFGIAAGATLESIEIHWPSGTVTTLNGGRLTDPAVWSNGTLTVVEPGREGEAAHLMRVSNSD